MVAEWYGARLATSRSWVRNVTKFFFMSVRNLDLGIAYCAVLKVTPGIDRSSTMSGATEPFPPLSRVRCQSMLFDPTFSWINRWFVHFLWTLIVSLWSFFSV